MKSPSLSAVLLFLSTIVLSALNPTTNVQAADDDGSLARLLRQPAVSAKQVAFVYAEDIWVVDRDGGEARRLTTYQGEESDPHFSPDGSLLAFTGEYDGNVDVYVVPTEGGEPRRLTWHPGADRVRGWTEDGSRVLFASGRFFVPRPNPRLWTVSLSGGMPDLLPIPRAAFGAFSPDGQRMAYQLVSPWESEWRNYRGGQAQPIRLIDLASLEVEKLPWEGSNDLSPVWLGETVFFLSDRDATVNVWAYSLATGQLIQRTHFTAFDCKQLSGGAGWLVFENRGYVYALDAAGGKARRLPITLRGDFPWARPHWESVKDRIRSFALSPSGQRALFEARGEIFTVPAKKGDARNLSHRSGSAERAPAWSPDGEKIAWFSDESGEYQLVIADQFGRHARTIALEHPTFFYTPRWSPDSKQIAFSDADRKLWVIDVTSGQRRLIGEEGFAHPNRQIYPAWSPDSKWIAFTRLLANQYHAIFITSLESGQSRQITDGLSDCHSPSWDASGKYLYFLASTDYGLNVGWLDMSSFERPQRSAIYLAVLSSEEPSPLAPESDDESLEEEKNVKDGSSGEGGAKEGAKSKAKTRESQTAKKSAAAGDSPEKGVKAKTPKAPSDVRIDFDGLSRRIVALGVPARNYGDLVSAGEGVLFYTERIENQPALSLHRYELEQRETKKFLEGVVGFEISADGKKLLYLKPEGSAFLVGTDGLPKPGEGELALDGLRMKVDPLAEARQIFREAWRFQRDYFYVENVHGLDLTWAYRSYAPWVEWVRHRSDLTHILDILGGETSIGHSFTGGGDTPEVERVAVGLLGADFTVEDGRFRIRKIYDAESWNPELRAPLSAPGLEIFEGDYLLAVDGVELVAGDNLYSSFDGKAGKQVVLSVHGTPTLEGAREVTVVPVADEQALRRRAWIEGNRRRVDELSGGRLAYIWLPDTGNGGYTNFNRYYFAQQDKQGAVIDERFNNGGSIADYVIDLMSRELVGYFNNPLGDKQPFTAPNAAIWGPKVMIINEMSGSGGDMLPYMFRLRRVGPLVGTRTWGGLVGTWDVPPLVDGGFITAPRGGFYDLEGHWAVEGEGIAPDIEVEQTPRLVEGGHDPQLERAVVEALELLKTQGVDLLPQPPDPVRVRRAQ